MVAHDAVGAYPHVEKFLALCENVFKRLEVGGLFENAETAVSTIEDVIDNATFIYSCWSWHNRKL